MMVGSFGRLLSRARIHRFGLIGGSTDRVDIQWLGNPFSRLTGMPKVTVDFNLSNWLDQCLSNLAGTGHDGKARGVLRFGHIWHKDYKPPEDPDHTEEQSAR